MIPPRYPMDPADAWPFADDGDPHFDECDDTPQADYENQDPEPDHE